MFDENDAIPKNKRDKHAKKGGRSLIDSMEVLSVDGKTKPDKPSTRVNSKTRKKIRRVTADFAIPDDGQHIMVIDNGCDTIILGPAWVPERFHPTTTVIDGGLPGMKGPTLPYVRGVSACKDNQGRDVLLVVEHGAYNESASQTESLFQPNALRADGVRVCDTPIAYGGEQRILAGGVEIPLAFNGIKCYLPLRAPTKREIDTYPRVILQSKPFRPYDAAFVRRKKAPSIDDWVARLGWASKDIVTKTLACTTQLVPTVEAETREMPRRHF